MEAEYLGMTKIFVLFCLGVGIFCTAPRNDASAHDKASPPGDAREDLRAVDNSKTDRAGSAPGTPASEQKTCSKFLPNVGLVMTVPCSDQPPEIPLQVAALPAIAKTADPTQPSMRLATAPEKAIHRLSRKTCSEILQRIQLDDARNQDRDQLRTGC